MTGPYILPTLLNLVKLCSNNYSEIVPLSLRQGTIVIAEPKDRAPQWRDTYTSRPLTPESYKGALAPGPHLFDADNHALFRSSPVFSQ